MRSTRTTRRTRLVAAALAAATSIGALSWYLTRPRQGGPLHLSDGYEYDMPDAHVGSTYNFGVAFTNSSGHPLRLLSARMTGRPDQLAVVPPLLGQTCGGLELPGADVGADLRKTRVKVDLTDLRARPVPGHATCYYVLYRFQPSATGHFTTSRGEITYQAGRRTYRRSFNVRFTLHVTATGPDPSDVYDPIP